MSTKLVVVASVRVLGQVYLFMLTRRGAICACNYGIRHSAGLSLTLKVHWSQAGLSRPQIVDVQRDTLIHERKSLLVTHGIVISPKKEVTRTRLACLYVNQLDEKVGGGGLIDGPVGVCAITNQEQPLAFSSVFLGQVRQDRWYPSNRLSLL